MFDDFVEHSSGAAAPGQLNSPAGNMNGLSLMHTEGFEPDEYEDDELLRGDELETLEQGYMPQLLPDGSLSIFSLSHVQFSLPSTLLALQVNSNTLVMAINPLSLILIDLSRPAELVNVDLPRPAPATAEVKVGASSPFIKELFGDPTGRHLLISVSTGDVFYLSTANLGPSPSGPTIRKPRPLRLRHGVSFAAWNPIPPASASGNTAAPTECLLGSADGSISTLSLPPNDDIFNLKSVSLARSFERDHADLYTVPESQTITGLAYGYWKNSSTIVDGNRVSGEKQVWLTVTTSQRIYQLQCVVPAGNPAWNLCGKGGWGEEMFRLQKESGSIPKFQDLPGDIPRSMISVFWDKQPAKARKSSLKSIAQPSVFAWLASPGLYYFQIPPAPTSTVIEQPELLSYSATGQGSQASYPVALLATEFHLILLFPSRLVAMSRLTEKIIWEENLNLRNNESAKGLISDPINKTCWFYTDLALYEIILKDEDRDVWKAKLGKNEFEDALLYAKDAKQKDIIESRQADSFFDQKRYLQAAQTYARSSRSFEFVALRFVDADEKDALRIYLAERLNRMPKSDLTQRMILATWLVEIYLSKCNTLEDIIAAEAATSDVESLRTELMLMEEDLRNFMTTYQSNLDAKVVYELIQSHGRTDVYLFFAGMLKDDDIVLQHYIDEEMWIKAIDVLNKQDSLELYYRHASILMAQVPKEVVDCWLKQPALDVRRLVPALLAHQNSSQSNGRAQTIRYLTTVIDRGSTDQVVHNVLITLLVKHDGEDGALLLRFLDVAKNDPMTDKPYYDLDYALRLCKQNDRILACVYIYSKMGLYESSVSLALEKDDLELAKLNADKPEDDDEMRRKLWLQIARHVVQDRKDIKSAMRFLEQTDLLKIEDILPFFPDFTVINDFKNEICNALEDYSTHIETLRGEMDDATRSADNIKSEIEELKNRFITIDANERCSSCQTVLATKQFYAFPCQHVFHADCLINLAKEFFPSASLRKIVHLQNELIRLSKPIKTETPDGRSRALFSAQSSMGATSEALAAALDPSALLIGGSRKLLAAGDKLRELIVPDILANAISVVGVGGGAKGSRKKGLVAQDARDQARVDKLREEIDNMLAASCVLCEGAVATLDRPFVTPADDDESWVV